MRKTFVTECTFCGKPQRTGYILVRKKGSFGASDSYRFEDAVMDPEHEPCREAQKISIRRKVS